MLPCSLEEGQDECVPKEHVWEGGWGGGGRGWGELTCCAMNYYLEPMFGVPFRRRDMLRYLGAIDEGRFQPGTIHVLS